MKNFEERKNIKMENIIEAKKTSKILEKALGSRFTTVWGIKLTERELIAKIFYYSGRALQGGNICYLDDLETLHYLIMEYADRCKHYRR